MPEDESRLDPNREAYKQQLSNIEAYYIEKGGVGSPDFIAFGDALRRARVDAKIKYYRAKVREGSRGGMSTYDAPLDSAYSEERVAELIHESHEEQYPGFSSLYKTAVEKVEGIIQNSPHINKSQFGHGENSYKDLDKIRDNIIQKKQ